jgi:hypothetical protein
VTFRTIGSSSTTSTVRAIDNLLNPGSPGQTAFRAKLFPKRRELS